MKTSEDNKRTETVYTARTAATSKEVNRRI